MATRSTFGGWAALLTGTFSILYAVFFLLVAPAAPLLGTLVSWVLLGGGGLLGGAAFCALYSRVADANPDLARFGLLLSLGAASATLLHAGGQALLIAKSGLAVAAAAGQSPVDPSGLATFGMTGVAALVFGTLILRSGALPRGLGWLGLLQGALLIALFGATAAGAQTLILLTGGPAALIVGPLWWFWLGRTLLRASAYAEPVLAAAR